MGSRSMGTGASGVGIGREWAVAWLLLCVRSWERELSTSDVLRRRDCELRCECRRSRRGDEGSGRWGMDDMVQEGADPGVVTQCDCGGRVLGVGRIGAAGL